MGTQAREVLPVIETKTFQNFLNKVGRRSESTRKLYGVGVKILTAFLQKAQPDDTIPVITKIDPYDLLDAFAGWLLEQGYSSNSVISFVNATKKWIRYNGVKVYTEEVKDKVSLPIPEEALDEAPTKAQIMEILSKVHFKTQSKMLLLTCTGIRPTDIWYLKWTDFKWDEHPVRLIVPPYGKTRRGWESFITDELAARLKIQNRQSEYIFTAGKENLRDEFRLAAKKIQGFNSVTRESRNHRRYKFHLYTLRKFFYSQCVTEVGDAVAQAWMGRKGYLNNYLRLSLEQRQKLYLKIMPSLAIFTSELPKTEDRLRGKLRAKGLSDETIDDVLEGLVLN